MSNPPPTSAPEPGPLTLSYDNYSATKDRRDRWVVCGYWAGTFISATALGVISSLLKQFHETEGPLFAWFVGMILPMFGNLLMLLPATLFLGLTLWLRTKLLTHARFARFRTAILTGVIGGAYPMFVDQILHGYSDRTSAAIMLGGLAWHILYPIAAGFWLCHRSHVRD